MFVDSELHCRFGYIRSNHIACPGPRAIQRFLSLIAFDSNVLVGLTQIRPSTAFSASCAALRLIIVPHAVAYYKTQHILNDYCSLGTCIVN